MRNQSGDKETRKPAKKSRTHLKLFPNDHTEKKKNYIRVVIARQTHKTLDQRGLIIETAYASRNDST